MSLECFADRSQQKLRIVSWSTRSYHSRYNDVYHRVCASSSRSCFTTFYTLHTISGGFSVSKIPWPNALPSSRSAHFNGAPTLRSFQQRHTKILYKRAENRRSKHATLCLWAFCFESFTGFPTPAGIQVPPQGSRSYLTLRTFAR